MKSFFSLYLVLALGTTFFACDKRVAKQEGPATYSPLDFRKANLGGTHNLSAVRLFDRHEATTNKRLSDDPAAMIPTLRELSIQQLKAAPIDLTAIGISKEVYVSTMIQMNDELAAISWDARNLQMPQNNVTNYFNQVMTSIENNQTQPGIDLALKAIKTKAMGELADLELDQVIAIIEVGCASAWLWSDEDGNFSTSTRTGRVLCCNGKRAMIADVSSLAGSFVRMGVMGAVFAATPGGNVAIFTGLALGAGISSGLAALANNQAIIPKKKELTIKGLDPSLELKPL